MNPTGQVPQPKDPREMTQSELVKEVESLRRQLHIKDAKLKKTQLESQKLMRENQSLGLKMQFEVKNNQLLLKNLNRMRQNYF